MGEQHHHPKLEHGGDAHAHAVRGGEKARLAGVLLVTAAVMAGEIAGYCYSRSLAAPM